MIWLIEAHFDHPCYINDYMRQIHLRIMAQTAQESLESQEKVDATFMCVG